ncbi:MAG TPA: hypothetical protein VIV60_29845 [Polyangiaceae bacterium]
MRRTFDTPLGREICSRRMGTVEPVFVNIQKQVQATIYTPWSEEGKRPVEALHDGTQHREGGGRGKAVEEQSSGATRKPFDSERHG